MADGNLTKCTTDTAGYRLMLQAGRAEGGGIRTPGRGGGRNAGGRIGIAGRGGAGRDRGDEVSTWRPEQVRPTTQSSTHSLYP